MTAPLSIPPCLDPVQAKPLGNRHEQAYRDHIARCRLEILRLALTELRELRLDEASAIEADGEPVTDWEAIAEARAGR